MQSLTRRHVLSAAPGALALAAVAAPAVASIAADHPDRELLEAFAAWQRADTALADAGQAACDLHRRVVDGIPGPDWPAFVDDRADVILEAAALGASEDGNDAAADAFREVRAAIREKARAREAQIAAALTAAGHDVLDARETALDAECTALRDRLAAMAPRTIEGAAALARFGVLVSDNEMTAGTVAQTLAAALEALAAERLGGAS